MNLKRLEFFATRIGIYSLLTLTAIGFLLVFDIAFDLDILPGNKLKTAAGVFAGLLFVVSCTAVLISIMINIKRVVEILDSHNNMDKANKEN